jgi:hypothetical protein
MAKQPHTMRNAKITMCNAKHWMEWCGVKLAVILLWSNGKRSLK